MNKRADPRATGTPIIPPEIERVIRHNLKSPKEEAEAKIRKAIQVYCGELYPDTASLRHEASELDRRIRVLQAEIERHQRHKERTHLLSIPFIGKCREQLNQHDRVKYRALAAATFIGIISACHSLATYISNSTAVPSLTDNYLAALFTALVPVSGALVFETYPLLLETDADVTRYNKQLAKGAMIALLAYICSATITFAPHSFSSAELQEAMINGVSPQSFVSKTISAVGPYMVLGSQLIFETLCAPVTFYYCEWVYKSGRTIEQPVSQKQRTHRAAIEELEKLIDGLTTALGHSGAELERRQQEEADLLDASLLRYRTMRAEFGSSRMHHDNDFIAKKGEAE